MVKVNLKQMKMRDFVLWNKKVQDASKSNNFDELFDSMSKVVSAWDFPGDPTDPEAYQELTLGDWQNVMKQTAEAMSADFST